MDFIGVAFHGMATSHIDALCHVFVDGQMYNGFSKDEVKSTGAQRGSILCARDGISSRGVLLDVPRALGVPWLEPRSAITVEQLEGAQGVLDNLRLDCLAEACAREGRWVFQFTVAPLRVDRATGSPVNPIAVL